MFSAFKNRRPWAAALVAFVLGPFVGMLYLNRGWLALLYWGLDAAITAFSLHLYFVANPQAFLWSLGLNLLIRIAGAAQSVLVARHWDTNQRQYWYSKWYAIIAIVFVVPLGLALTLRTFVYQPFNTPAASMSPTLNVGDYFFASKFAYSSSEPQRGDLVVFHTQIGGGLNYIKRIIGLPGDRVQMKNDRLYINGVVVPQRRIADYLEPCEPAPCRVTQYEETLPGSRTDRTLDRVTNGPFDNTQVFVVPPNAYFVLGDNRDNSDDSRVDVGFVSRGDIIGRVAYKYIENGRLVWKPVN
jgi:signal peptidase I